MNATRNSPSSLSRSLP